MKSSGFSFLVSASGLAMRLRIIPKLFLPSDEGNSKMGKVSAILSNKDKLINFRLLHKSIWPRILIIMIINQFPPQSGSFVH